MSTDADRTIERLYRALGDDARLVPLAPPEALRRRGDRRARRRAALVAVVAAVIAGGAVVAGSILLIGDDVEVTPAPAPTVTTVPTPSTPPSVTPSAAASSQSAGPSKSTAAADPPPTTVPRSVLILQTESDGAFLPELCGRGWGDTEPRAMRVATGFLPGPEPADSAAPPEAILDEGVVVHTSVAHARDWLDGLRGAVEACPEGPGEAAEPGPVRYELETDAPEFAGDDAVVIHERRPGYDLDSSKPNGSTMDFWTAAVRYGDTVVTLRSRSYENWGLQSPDRFYALFKTAVQRVLEWRGTV